MNNKKKWSVAAIIAVIAALLIIGVFVQGKESKDQDSNIESTPVMKTEQGNAIEANVPSQSPLASILPENTMISEQKDDKEAPSIAPDKTEIVLTAAPTSVVTSVTETPANSKEETIRPESSNKPTSNAQTRKPAATTQVTSGQTKAPSKNPQTETAKTKAPTVTKAPASIPTKTPYKPTIEPEHTPKSNGKITFTIDASVIGNGTYLNNHSIELEQAGGEQASKVITRGLKENGFSYSSTGTLEENFYLSSISKTGLVKSPTVSSHVKDILDEYGVRLNINKYDSDRLGEFHFTRLSGWRYSVNGVYPNHGMSDYILKPGDHVVLKYTLCMGYDS